METIAIPVASAARRSDILVDSGAFRRWPDLLRERLPARQYLVVADANVARLHPVAAMAPGPVVTLTAGENEKSLLRYAALCEELLSHRPDRKTVVVALGGGIVGDMAGFAAATLLRGVRCAQIPTTLLAQVDSSVGGKTGVNAAAGKNLVGAFHQPELVVIDPELLATLPRREWLTGYAEVVKYALLGDAAFFAQLDGRPPAPGADDPGRLATVIAHCCRMKAAVVADDERERGRRALLNYGHTFGHALEALAGYDGRVTHGEAVAVGMMLAAAFAVSRGIAPAELPGVMLRHWRRAGLAARIDELGRGDGRDVAAVKSFWRERLAAPELVAALAQDKKADAAALTLILPRQLGVCEAFAGFAPEEVADFMRRSLDTPE